MDVARSLRALKKLLSLKKKKKYPHGSVLEMDCLKLSLISKAGRRWTEAGGAGGRGGEGLEGESWGRGDGGENPKPQTIAEIGMCFGKSVWIFHVDPILISKRKYILFSHCLLALNFCIAWTSPITLRWRTYWLWAFVDNRHPARHRLPKGNVKKWGGERGLCLFVCLACKGECQLKGDGQMDGQWERDRGTDGDLNGNES